MRCAAFFRNEEELRDHHIQSTVCIPSHDGLSDRFNDPEDGVAGDAYQALSAREYPHRLTSWEAIWKVLFPSDLVMPAPGTLYSRSAATFAIALMESVRGHVDY